MNKMHWRIYESVKRGGEITMTLGSFRSSSITGTRKLILVREVFKVLKKLLRIEVWMLPASLSSNTQKSCSVRPMRIATVLGCLRWESQ